VKVNQAGFYIQHDTKYFGDESKQAIKCNSLAATKQKHKITHLKHKSIKNSPQLRKIYNYKIPVWSTFMTSREEIPSYNPGAHIIIISDVHVTEQRSHVHIAAIGNMVLSTPPGHVEAKVQ